MANKIRYAIVGTGLMGLEHIRNIELLDNAEVAAIADPTPKSREWARRLLGDEVPSFASIEDLLKGAEVDAVVISSPNYTHAEVLEPLWGTGKHILVEKPMCTTLEDCRRVARAAEKHNGVFWVGMEYRYMPPVAELASAVHRGDIGTLRMLSIREHRFPFLPKVGDWNRFNRFTGGTLVEKCCHFFDLMTHIIDSPPTQVFASGAQDVNHLDESYDGEVPDILDNAFVLVDFACGARAMLDLCMFAEASRNEQEISAVGELGKVECFVPDSTVVRGLRATKEIETQTIEVAPELLAAGHHHGSTYYEHSRFLRAIEGGDVEVTAEAGGLAVAIGVAAQESIASGQPVAVSDWLSKP